MVRMTWSRVLFSRVTSLTSIVRNSSNHEQRRGRGLDLAEPVGEELRLRGAAFGRDGPARYGAEGGTERGSNSSLD
jgi:hypothetical protein